MNLSETLNKLGASQPAVTKENYNTIIAQDEEEMAASFGMANDSLHFAVIDIVPPKNSVPLTNSEQRMRKSKAYKKWEKERQLAQDPGPRRTIVESHKVDNSDILEVSRVSRF